MLRKVNRREFVKSSFVAPAAIAAAPTMLIPSEVEPVVISDVSGIRFKNGGPMSSVEMAFYRMTQGDRVIDAVVAGVQIPENDPEESGIGYGGLPNADGVVQLELSYQLTSDLTVAAGADVFYGTAEGLFGQFDERDRFTLRFEISL